MALDSANVRVAVTGALSVAPTATAGPTDADTPLAAAWADLGYFSDDGVTETRERDTEQITAWQNAAVVRELVTGGVIRLQGTMIETKKETVEMYYASEVAADGSIIIVPTDTGGRQGFVLDIIDGDDFIRAWVPSGEVTEVDDQEYVSGAAIGYPVTITAYPDSRLTTADGKQGSVKKWYSSLAA